MEAAPCLAVLQELLVADGEEGTLEGAVDGQLVVGPLDGREGGAQAFDFLASVKGLAADEEVGDAASLQRLHEGARHILCEAGKAPEEETHVARGDWHGRAGQIALRDAPASLSEQPGDECRDGAGERGVHRRLGQRQAAVGFRHGERDDRGLPVDRVPVRGQGDVGRLERGRILSHDGRKGGVDEILQLGHRAETGSEIEARDAPPPQAFLDDLIDADVGAAEAIDRLLGIADETLELGGEADPLHVGRLEGVPRTGAQAALVQERGDLRVGVFIQERIHLVAGFGTGGAQLPGRQGAGQRERGRRSPAEADVRRDLALLEQGDIFDEQRQHPLAL